MVKDPFPEVKDVKRKPKPYMGKLVVNPEYDPTKKPGDKGYHPMYSFRDNPQLMGQRFKKEDSISCQYRRFLRMSEQEREDWYLYCTGPKGKRDKKVCSLAAKIAYKRIAMAATEAGLNDTKEITDRTEGKATQLVKLEDTRDNDVIMQQLHEITQKVASEIKPKDLQEAPQGAIEGEVEDSQEEREEIL